LNHKKYFLCSKRPSLEQFLP